MCPLEMLMSALERVHLPIKRKRVEILCRNAVSVVKGAVVHKILRRCIGGQDETRLAHPVALGPVRVEG